MCPLMEEGVIVSARGGVGYCACSCRSGLLCPIVEKWVNVPAHGGVGYCVRPWRSGLLCPLAMRVEEWVILPAGYARGGVGYCARYR